MGVTAKTRSRLRLDATTTLGEEDVRLLLKQAADSKLGGGASLLTSGVSNIGANVSVVREAPGILAMALTSGKQLIELCTFTARIATKGGATSVQVGGLDTYKTVQDKLFFVIPAGPKRIHGMSAYKKFLHLIEQAIIERDGSATVIVGEPTP